MVIGALATPALQAQDDDLVLAVLKAGQPAEPINQERAQELSRGHLANINRLVEEGTLLIAGPLVPGGAGADERGLFFLDVASIDEARRIVSTDPAIAAGALQANLSTFRTPYPLRRTLELERAARQARLADGQAADFKMRAWVIATAPSGDATEEALNEMRRRGEIAFSGTSATDAGEEVWAVLDAPDLTAARGLFEQGDADVAWSLRTWYSSVEHEQMPRLAVRPDAPTFEILEVREAGRFAPFHGSFEKRVEVFGVQVLATEQVHDKKVLHAAHVTAQYLDNDEDGQVDDPAVHAALIRGGAFLAMAATERDFHRLDPDWDALESGGFRIGQDLYGEETLPEGPPHVKSRGRFDASLEEVWHLISNGWGAAYPAEFGYQPGSELCDAMDLARGGRFRRIPRRYPAGAWYHYDDRTCGYRCMAAEYFYWTLTSLLGGQDYPGRAEQIADEWECPTAESLERRDPAAFSLLTDPRWALPRSLPDGSYAR